MNVSLKRTGSMPRNKTTKGVLLFLDEALARFIDSTRVVSTKEEVEKNYKLLCQRIDDLNSQMNEKTRITYEFIDNTETTEVKTYLAFNVIVRLKSFKKSVSTDGLIRTVLTPQAEKVFSVDVNNVSFYVN